MLPAELGYFEGMWEAVQEGPSSSNNKESV